MENEKFENYVKFVDSVTSNESKDVSCLIERLNILNKNINVARLLTAGLGIGSEGGEISEIVKKVILQGKPIDDETKFHLKRECGDLIWYISQLLMVLDLNLDEVIEENINKLQSRYPGGFDAWRSENRKTNDL